jgi:hypothetical protein
MKNNDEIKIQNTETRSGENSTHSSEIEYFLCHGAIYPQDSEVNEKGLTESLIATRELLYNL